MNPILLIVGNACSLLAMVTDSISNTRKTTRGVLAVQSVSQVIYGVGTAVLGGYSGTVQNAMSVVRNLLVIKGVNSKVVRAILAITGVALGIYFNNLGLVGWLPIIANLEYTLAVFYFRNNERALKISFMVAVTLFGIFNGFIYNFVGVGTNAFVLITGIIALTRKPKQEANHEQP